MNDLALLLAGDLETYTGLEAAVTFGEPADPTGTGCELIKVWVVSVQPRDTDPQICTTLSRLTLAFRLYSCYPVQERDLTVTQEESAALTLYTIGRAVWCGLVDDKDTGLLMGIGECKRITLSPMVTDPPRGGVASMTGTLTVDYDCPSS